MVTPEPAIVTPEGEAPAPTKPYRVKAGASITHGGIDFLEGERVPLTDLEATCHGDVVEPV